MNRRGIPAVLGLAALAAAGLALVLADRSSARPRPGAERSGPREGPPPVALPALEGRGPTAAPDAGEAAAAEGAAAPPPEAGVSFRVDLVDAESGALLGGTWRLGPEPVAAPFAPGQVVTEEAAERQARANEEAFEATFRPSGVVSEGEFSPGDAIEGPVLVRPPRGWVTVDAEPFVRFTAAADAAAVHAVVPLAREAVLDLRVLDPEGRPARGSEVAVLLVAGEVREARAENLGPGVLRVRGIPFLPGEPVKVVVGWTPEAEVELVSDVDEALASPTLETVVPTDLRGSWEVTVRVTEPRAFLTFRESITYDNDVEAVEASLEGGGPSGRVRARVLSWDGKPVPGATVRPQGLETDARGEAVLPGLQAGPRTIRATAPGRFPAEASGVVRAGEEALFVLREPAGARLDVLVTDAEGRPRPSARVYVSGVLVLDVVDGVQRVDPFTDARGRRSFARVQPGRARVVASWGSRVAAAEVDLADGDAAVLRLSP